IALHAQQAEALATVAWVAKGTGDHHYLLEDQQARTALGPIIGRVAHSHWWSTEELVARFGKPLGAPGWCPNSWQVDALKIACLLRVADAAHLDERRSPTFLRVLRQPAGISDCFWQFQEQILQPRMDAGRLVYSAKRAFGVDEATAWWLC